jgi:hypothetical protein
MEQVIRSTSPIDTNLAETLILEAKSAAFRNKAIGIAAAIGIPGLTLSLGVAAIVWAANRPSLDPDLLKAVVASMLPLKVEGSVKADGEVSATPAQAQPPKVMRPLKPDEDHTIKTTVTVFKSLPYGDGEVTSGWVFASGDAKTPSRQYCYYIRSADDGNSNSQSIADDRVTIPVAGVTPAEQDARFQKCQWWQVGSL